MKVRVTIPLIGACLLAAGCMPPEEEDEVQKTLRMVEEAKRPAGDRNSRNVYISVERISTALENSAGLAVMWKYAGGKVTVSGSHGLARGGLRLGLAGADFDARLSSYVRRTRGLDRSSQEIMVLSGEEGCLWVGRDSVVPLLRIATESGETVVLQRVRVGTSLTVRPRLLADGSIELELAPSFSVLEGPRSGSSYRLSSMSTMVVVRPDEKIVIGSSSSSRQDSVATGLLGYDSSGTERATIITVKASKL